MDSSSRVPESRQSVLSKDRATPRLVFAWVLLVALAFVCVPAASFLMRGRLQHGPGTLDESVRARILASHTSSLDVLALIWAAVGSAPGMSAIAIVATIWLWRSCGRTAGIIIAAPTMAMLLDSVSKHISQRPRPIGGMDHFSSSFPSGHTATSTAVLLTLAVVLRRERVVSWPVAALVGVLFPLMIGGSRIYRDAHWTTDVIGGLIVGGIVAAASLSAYLHLRQAPPSAVDAETVISGVVTRDPE